MDGSVPYEGGEIAYRDHGGSGPTVMLLHGLGGNLAHWNLVAPLLAGQYRLVALDLPSHGASTAPAEHSFEHDLGAVDEVRTSLGLDRPAVVGHSYGGMLAIALGARIHDGYRVVVNIDGLGFSLGADDTVANGLAAATTAEEAVPLEDVAVSSGDDAWLEGEVRREVDEAAAIGLHLDPDGEMVRRAFQKRDDGRWHASPTLARFLEIARAITGTPLLDDYAAASCRTVTVIASHGPSPDAEEAEQLRLRALHARSLLLALGTEVESIDSHHYPHVEVPELTAQRFPAWVADA